MINLTEEQVLILEAILKDKNAEFQVLNNESEKPLVYHKKHQQISLILNGEGFAIKNNDVFSIKRGSLLMLNRNDKHSFYCPKGEMQILHLHAPTIYGDEDRYIAERIAKKWDNL